MSGFFEISVYVFAAILGGTIILPLSKVIRQIHVSIVFVLAFLSFFFGYISSGVFCLGLLVGNVIILMKKQKSDNSFSILQVLGSNEYLGAFIEYYKRDIYHFSPFYKRNPESTCFLVLNKIDVVGVFIVTVQDKKTLYIDLDFVIEGYRDYSVGKYLFIENIQYFKDLGYESIQTVCLNGEHEKYLLNMGFTERTITGERLYVKEII